MQGSHEASPTLLPARGGRTTSRRYEENKNKSLLCSTSSGTILSHTREHIITTCFFLSSCAQLEGGGEGVSKPTKAVVTFQFLLCLSVCLSVSTLSLWRVHSCVSLPLSPFGPETLLLPTRRVPAGETKTYTNEREEEAQRPPYLAIFGVLACLRLAASTTAFFSSFWATSLVSFPGHFQRSLFFVSF